MGFQDKVAVVTGAAGTGAGGTGRAITRRLLEAGAKVVLVDLNEEAGRSFEKTLTEEGYDVLFVKCDISHIEDVQNVYSQAETKYGRVDILVNCAFRFESQGHRILEGSIDEWKAVMDVNINGTYYMIRFGLPLLMKQERSAIVNVSSCASIQSDPDTAAYGSAKGAVNTLTKCVAVQYGGDGVRCNAVLPGLILSSETEQYLRDNPYIEVLKRQSVAKKSYSSGDDVARTVVFLADPDNEMLTGQLIVVDGGASVHNPAWSELVKK